MKKLILTIVVIFLFTQSAVAHHLWAEKEANKFRIMWGHYPEIYPYAPEQIKEIKAFDRKGKEVNVQRKDEKDNVYLFSNANISMITISLDNGFLVTTPEGKKSLTKREAQKTGLQVIDSVYSYQFAKSLFGSSYAAVKPTGMKFEIVPLKIPHALKPTDTLPVKVLLNGMPAEGINIEINNNKETIKTNNEGIANLKMSEKGKQSIVAKKRIPVKDNPDADYLSYTTVLTFELK